MTMYDTNTMSASFEIRPRATVHFEFDVGDRVVIRGLSMEADVIGLAKDTHGEQYKICWWYGGVRYEVWVFSREILLKPKVPT